MLLASVLILRYEPSHFTITALLFDRVLLIRVDPLALLFRSGVVFGIVANVVARTTAVTAIDVAPLPRQVLWILIRIVLF